MTEKSKISITLKTDCKKAFCCLLIILQADTAVFAENEKIKSEPCKARIERRNSGYGLVSGSGQTVIPFDFLGIHPAGNCLFSLIYLEQDKFSSRTFYKYGIVDDEGKELIPLTYDRVTEVAGKYLVLKSDEKFTLFDKTSMTRLPQEYEQIDTILYKRDIFKAKRNGKWAIFNSMAEPITGFEYDEIISSVNSKEPLIIKKDGKSGILTIGNEEKLLPSDYAEIEIEGRFIIAHKTSSESGKADIYDIETTKPLMPNAGINYDHFGLTNPNGDRLIISEVAGYDTVGTNIIKRLKKGAISIEGVLLAPIKYDDIFFSNELVFAVKKEGKRKYFLDVYSGKGEPVFRKQVYGLSMKSDASIWIFQTDKGLESFASIDRKNKVINGKFYIRMIIKLLNWIFI